MFLIALVKLCLTNGFYRKCRETTELIMAGTPETTCMHDSHGVMLSAGLKYVP